MPGLFEPYPTRQVTFRNRIVVSPMCQYSSTDGFASDWHLVHLGSRAVGGAGAVIVEATAVTPDGRISPEDLGIWKDQHGEMLGRIAAFLDANGAVAGIQLAHAGRKASTYRPWAASQGMIAESEGGWRTAAPSALRFAENYPMPEALTEEGIAAVIAGFRAAAHRARHAGFRLVEIHAAHGYLLNEFLSPLSNVRDDRWGGPFENRIRLVLEIVAAVRQEWPASLPLWLRISATDHAPGGWMVDESVELARRVMALGVDLIDCSSGGNVSGVRYPIGPGYQVEFAERIRREAGIATGAVGLITAAPQAEQIIRNEQADVVLLARELLREPYWPLKAAHFLGVPAPWPSQYLRAAPPPIKS